MASRMPSFIHSYAKKSSKRGRSESSPTGKTPLQRAKRIEHENIDPTSIRKKWSTDEKKFLHDFVDLAGGVPDTSSGSFWEECAGKLNTFCKSFRTAAMCRAQYYKVKKLFQSSDATNVNTNCRNVSLQTDLVIPVQKEKSVFSRFVPLVRAEDVEVDSSDTAVNEIVKSLKRSLSNDEREIPNTERNTLLNVLSFPNSSVGDFVGALLQQETIMTNLKAALLSQSGVGASSKCVRSKESYLFSCKYPDLKEFSFTDVLTEMSTCQPFLLDHLLSVAVTTQKLISCSSEDFLLSLVPKLTLIYSILMTTRFPELSRMQKVISSTLIDEHVHQKVFDRLQIMGVTTSYSGASRIIDEVGKHNHDEIVDFVRDGGTIRLIGDNINIHVGVKHERLNHHSNMLNWFASAIITQSNPFSELNNQPQGQAKDLPMEAFHPTETDDKILKSDYGVHICRIAKEFCPHLNFLHGNAKDIIKGEYTDTLQQKNLVVPLPTLPLNEQKYSEVVDILENYESTLMDIFTSAEQDVPNVHIGGDQLTRERFSGAKGLRTGGTTPQQRFDHLYPISFEMWHTGMNFLTLIFKVLFSPNSFTKGTLNAAKIKLSRKTVHEDVKNHFDHDKDFFVSFLKSYVVEGLCDFFGMEGPEDIPTKNLPPEEIDEQQSDWLQNKLDEFIDHYVLAITTDASGDQTITRNVSSVTPLQVNLPDGNTVVINVTRIATRTEVETSHDRLKHYGHTVLQLGLLFIQFLDVCKVPDRQRMITTFKFMMRMLKSFNNRSKYALEILRFLCHQQSTYSLQEAHQSFYGLFVNTTGKTDGNIPADLQMEHIIRRLKKLYKHSGPSNIQGFLIKKSKSLSGLMQISNNFDATSNVIIRSKKHKNKDAQPEELKILKDLREVRPFQRVLGRDLEKFNTIRAPADVLDSDHYDAWIRHHQNVLTFEPGK